MEHLTIKELPNSERPYEKAAKYGVGALSDAELLAVIIRSGTKDKTSVDIAREILRLSSNHQGLRGLCRAKAPELKKIDGIGDVKSLELLCIVELAKRIARSTDNDVLQFKQPEEIATYFMEELRSLDTEHLYAVLLDSAGHLIRYEVVFKGSIDSSMISPREIMRFALTYDASRLVILHNHPGGNPTPSPEDDEATELINKASKLIGIPLIDHIIIGDNTYISYALSGRL